MSASKKEGGGEALIIQAPVRGRGRARSCLMPRKGSCYRRECPQRGTGLQAKCAPDSRSHMDWGSLTSFQQTENKPWVSP